MQTLPEHYAQARVVLRWVAGGEHQHHITRVGILTLELPAAQGIRQRGASHAKGRRVQRQLQRFPTRAIQHQRHRAARRLRREEINAASPLGLCQFASFEVERYSDAVEPELGISPREYMGKLLNYCRGYAAKFSQNSPNLLFMGHTGLGKTHLALAIADAVLEGGHDVLYTSAAALAAQLGREHFNYTTNDEWLAACQEADLLILDDLGTEYITPLTISVLYELINTRMLTHRPTIYTTNITDQSVFVARYTEKVASRMLGGCKMFKFFGTDQRLK